MLTLVAALAQPASEIVGLAPMQRQAEPDAAAQVRTLNHLTASLLKEGRLEEALPVARLALSFAQVFGEEHELIIQSISNRGALARLMGDWTLASAFLKRALELKLSVFGHNSLEAAHGMTELAVLHHSTGDLPNARGLLERALEIRRHRQGESHPDTASTMSDLGVVLQEMGDLDAALPLVDGAYKIHEETNGRHHPDTARSLANLAKLRAARGELNEARADFQLALEIREKLHPPNQIDVAMSLADLGSFLLTLGVLDSARPLLECALDIRRNALGEQHPRTATSYDSLAALMAESGEKDDALRLARRALEIRKASLGMRHPDTAWSLANVGSSLHSMGKFAEALPLKRAALEVRREVLGSNHPETAASLDHLGMLLAATGELVEARRSVEQAFRVREARLGRDHPDVIESLRNLALVDAAMGNRDSALRSWTAALEGEERLLDAMLSLGSRRDRESYLRKFLLSTHDVVTFHLRSSVPDVRTAQMAATTVLRRKGRTLDFNAERLHRLQGSGSAPSGSVLARLSALRARRASLLFGTTALSPEARVAMEGEIEDEIRTLEAALSDIAGEARESATAATLEDVEARLAPDTALVEFFVHVPRNALRDQNEEPRYVAFVVTRSSDVQWVDLGPAAAVYAAAAALHRSIAVPGFDVLERARALDRLTMERVRPLLGEAQKLVVAPDGVLSTVPFAALVDSDGHYLIECYGLSYVTSGRDLLRPRAPDAHSAPLVLGDPSFDADPVASSGDSAARRSTDLEWLNFERLGRTEDEAREVARLLSIPEDRVLLGPSATEAAVRNLRGPRILHLATHGFFLPDLRLDPSRRGPAMSYLADEALVRSGLALSGFNKREGTSGANDGVLTALEVLSLDLVGTELVVLSACETGLGESIPGEGVYGLRRAFVLAGALSQVMTLWKVGDEQARDLMVSLYGQLLQGAGRAAALRELQLAALRGDRLPVIKKRLSTRGVDYIDIVGADLDLRLEGTRHPHYWASMILSGEPGPLRRGQVGPGVRNEKACHGPAGATPDRSECESLPGGSSAPVLALAPQFGSPR